MTLLSPSDLQHGAKLAPPITKPLSDAEKAEAKMIYRALNAEDALCRAYALLGVINMLAGPSLSPADIMKIQNLTVLGMRDIKATLPGIVQNPNEGQSATV